MMLIKEYIRTFLLEEDDSASSDVLEMNPVDKLALVVDGARHATTFILYNPRYYALKMKEEIKGAFEEFRKIKLKGDLNDFRNFYSFSNVQDIFLDTEGIYGFLNINMGRMIGLEGGCFEANEIRSVAARQGYGLIMYLIALSVESPVMPNRSKVSNQSKKFWKYLESEHGKVETDRFSDENSLHQKTEKDCKVHNDSILDRAYSVKKPIKLVGLVRRHRIFLEQMREFFEKNDVDFIKSRVSEYISAAGKLFFETTEYKD